ncbi:sushi domain-containing protein 1-like [Hoplias malabaricus]|uniref:sushi domain-containing protein 1-like n=1 Tax=Hoplias malabaricus TaxID=27720 RepID=UPI003462FE8B
MKKIAALFTLIFITMAFSLFTVADMDVCASCHANATCEEKTDGSGGKVCNCMYGFVGNGRTHCQDKDECQLGRICGDHTVCHNTFGSYYCTCLQGYTPSNNMANFIPNDGTFCRDVNECEVEHVCGEGGVCINTEGDFSCFCQTGYKVRNGLGTFHPQRDSAYCQIVDCGPPPTVPHTVQFSESTVFRSVVRYECSKGYVWRNGRGGGEGGNTSSCKADGQWSHPKIRCEELNCGEPQLLAHSERFWEGLSVVGSIVSYKCLEGFFNIGTQNTSVCSALGTWNHINFMCTEIQCGPPLLLPHAVALWDGSSKMGSEVVYECEVGYRAKGSGEMLCNSQGQWTHTYFSCKEIVCEDPPVVSHSVRLWSGDVRFNSTVLYYCSEGYYPAEGKNMSVCSENGSWSKPSLVCREIHCGIPPSFPHAVMLWSGLTKIGSEVQYKCSDGFFNIGTEEVSVCSRRGSWSIPYFLCREVDCGGPPPLPHTVLSWDGETSLGSMAFYECVDGYHSVSVDSVSVCGSSSQWSPVHLHCEEICCGTPSLLPPAVLHWDGSCAPGSVATYSCPLGLHLQGQKTHSTCTTQGTWENVSITCRALCGPVPVVPHTEVLWENGTVVVHRCVKGYYSFAGTDISVCDVTGRWQVATLLCRAFCGPVPSVPHTEVLWENGTVVFHRCVKRYYSRSGSHISVCDVTGRWQVATLHCREVEFAVKGLMVFNKRCLRWRSDSETEGHSEQFRVLLMGQRDFDPSFSDRQRKLFSSVNPQHSLCLNLQPATNYTITVTAQYTGDTSTITVNTSIPVPPTPEVTYSEVDTQLPILRLRRTASTLDLICVYQVIVLPVEGVLVFDCGLSLVARRSCGGEYIAAELELKHLGKNVDFKLGDSQLYGEYYNAPLERGRNYYVILRTLCQWRESRAQSCATWAKARVSSYSTSVSAMLTFGSIGALGVMATLGYCCSWFWKVVKF